MKSIKNNGLIALFVFFSISIINAQEYGWGASVGLNYSNASLGKTDPLDATPLSGVSAALIFNFQLSKYFSFQPEIRFNQNETETLRDSSLLPLELKETGKVFNRLEIPLLFKANIGNGFFKIHPYLGINQGMNLSVFNEFRSSTQSESGTMTKQDLDPSEYSKFFYENISGVIVSIRLKKASIIADYRYPFQFSSSNELRNEGVTKNRGAAINIGVIYNP